MFEQRFNHEMLVLAREYRNLTQKELEHQTGIDQTVISRIESGAISPNIEHEQSFATALGFPVEFFTQTDRVVGMGGSFLFHRRRKSIKPRDLKQVEATVNILAFGVRRLLRGVDSEHEYSINPLVAGRDGSPEAIAQLTRASWCLPDGPILSIADAVERAGAILIRTRFQHREVDGISLWPRDLPPLIFVNKDIPADRENWTIAHELGHLVMHKELHMNIEDEADRFASEFLMPARSIKPEIRSLTLPKAAQLKLRWRVSMQALIRRAVTLELLTDRQYRYLMTQTSKAGYRKEEPNEFPKSRASNLESLLDLHIKELGYTEDEMCKKLNIVPDEYRAYYCNDSIDQKLRLVM